MNGWVAVAYVVCVLVAVAALELVGRWLRSPDHDTGDLWVRLVTLWTGLTALLWLTHWLEHLGPALWQTGRHPHFDLLGIDPFPDFLPPHQDALLLVLGPWLLTALVLLFVRRSDRREARQGVRWLAGALGPGNRRWWLLASLLPFAAGLYVTFPEVGRGPAGFPGANWGAMLVLAASLFGLAWSWPRALPLVRESTAAEARSWTREPWPEALRRRGLEVTKLRSWSPTPGDPRSPRGRGVEELERWLRGVGERQVAPQLVEAGAELVHADLPGGAEAGPLRVVLAQDACGQAEVVAGCAVLLGRRAQCVTLVITEDGEERALAARLDRALSGGAPGTTRRVEVFHSASASQPEGAMIWVAGAEVLSDVLMSELASRESSWARRIGFVVWWRLDRFTGVRGANLWAISRRLHRILRFRGRNDVRTLALLRPGTHGDSQVGSFVERIFPQTHRPEQNVRVEPRFAHEVHLHRVGLADAEEGTRRAEAHLQALEASVRGGWITRRSRPQNVTEGELKEVADRSHGDGVVGDHLVPDRENTVAEIHAAGPEDVLCLHDLVAANGRQRSSEGLQHVGLVPSGDPYVDYLLASYGSETGPPDTSRRLVCAEAQARVFDRHLRLALEEHAESRSELLRSFLYNEEILEATVRRLADRGELTSHEIRYLDSRDRLQIDRLYETREVHGEERYPLTTVGPGSSLVRVRDSGAIDEEEGVRLRVDPERLTIDAYPGRVFLHRGRRYRIRPWSDCETVARRGELECVVEDQRLETWRERSAWIERLEPVDSLDEIRGAGERIGRVTVSLVYREDLKGLLRRHEGRSGRASVERERRNSPILGLPLPTRGLVLRLTEEADPGGVAGVAQALDHVIPVHLGVEPDALAVLSLGGEHIDGEATHGVVIVDLYPGGVGLIDAIRDDHDFILRLLSWTKAWLQSTTDDACMKTVAARAAGRAGRASRRAAVALLDRLV